MSGMPPTPMGAPCSAIFLALKARRYLVRSQVTRPTTINAITVTPAKIPSPIGSTCSFFPGNVNGVAEAEASSAAADAVTEAEDGATESIPDATTAAGTEVAVVPTEETTLLGAIALEVGALGAAVDEAVAIEDGKGTDVTPFTAIAGTPVLLAAAALDDGSTERVAVGANVGPPDVTTVGNGTNDAAPVEVAAAGEDAELAVLAAAITEQDSTCWTWLSPELSTTGVSVTVHISVTGPLGVSTV